MNWTGIKVSTWGLIAAILSYLALSNMADFHLFAVAETIARLVMIACFFIGLFLVAIGILIFGEENGK